ncbi:MAG: FliH/SctL family protein [Gammaproteobacteria bacterium]
MEKIEIDELQVNEWIYPEVNTLIKKKNTPPAEEVALNLAKKEVEKLRQAYEEKLLLLDNLIKKLKNPLQILDDELAELMHELIHSSVKKIIYKELKSDPKLINNMINLLKSSIEEKGKIINVYLSPIDYERIKDIESDPTRILHVNSELSEGDIIIKSNCNEIHALLNERIDKMFRDKK